MDLIHHEEQGEDLMLDGEAWTGSGIPGSGCKGFMAQNSGTLQMATQVISTADRYISLHLPNGIPDGVGLGHSKVSKSRIHRGSF